MKRECDLFADLLPLYQDDLLSEESKRFVKNHIETCTHCREKYRNYDKKQTFDFGSDFVDYATIWNKRRILSGFFGLYAVILLIAYLHGSFLLAPDDAMGYALLYFYFLLPVTSSITTAVYIYYTGIGGLLAGAVMGYLNLFIAAVIFHYDKPWLSPLEKENFIFYLPVLFGALTGILIWLFHKCIVLLKRKEMPNETN